MYPKKSKYNNKKCTVIVETDFGDMEIKFDSKKEKAFFTGSLYPLLKTRFIKDLELQPVFELQPKYKKDGKTIRAIKYIADFKVTYADGDVRIYDVKGMRTEIFKLKSKLFHFKYPELTIEEV